MRKKAMKYVAQVTKLSTEKVELAIQDYNKFEQELSKSRSDLTKLESSYEQIKKEILVIRRRAGEISVDVSAVLKQNESQVNKDVKAARDLGVDTKPFNNAYQDVRKIANDIQKSAERIVQQLGKVR